MRSFIRKECKIMGAKICYITTVPLTLESFVLPIVKNLLTTTDWEISMICDESEAFKSLLPKEVHYYPIKMARGINLDGIAAIRQMVKIFRKEKFDLVQYSTPNAALYASIAAKAAGVPIRLYCQWGLAYVGFTGLKRKIFKLIEKGVCRRSTWIEPDSRGNLEFGHAEGLYPVEKGSVIWNGSASGVDMNKFDYTHKAEWRAETRENFGIPEDAFVYMFVGRITGDKGINELLTAFQRILTEKENTYLLLVGGVEKAESVNAELYHWAEENPYVIFCGRTNVVERYLAAADVYVLPSYREGFGSVVVEAEAMGVAVIVTNIPGPTEAMAENETGLVVKKKDAASLTQAMIHLQEHPKLCIQFGEKGHEFAASRFEQRQLASYIKEDRERLLQGASNGETEPYVAT